MPEFPNWLVVCILINSSATQIPLGNANSEIHSVLSIKDSMRRLVYIGTYMIFSIHSRWSAASSSSLSETSFNIKQLVKRERSTKINKAIIRIIIVLGGTPVHLLHAVNGRQSHMLTCLHWQTGHKQLFRSTQCNIDQFQAVAALSAEFTLMRPRQCGSHHNSNRILSTITNVPITIIIYRCS